MEIRISGKNTEVSDDLRLFTERKVTKLQKFISRDITALVTLSTQAGKKGSKSHRAEVVMHIKGKVISAKVDNENFFIAVDAVVEKLRRQLKKEKNKWLEKTKDTRVVAIPEPMPEIIPDPVETADSIDLEVRPFALKPMSVEDAITTLEGIDQSFFLFVNDEQTINCVYKKSKGGFGIMVPESALIS